MRERVKLMSLLIEVLDSNIWILITAIVGIAYTEYSIKRMKRALRKFTEVAMKYYIQELAKKKKDDDSYYAST